MELDNRKKSRQDGMMRSKSFDMQQVRKIGWKQERLSHLMDGNNGRSLPDGRKGMCSPVETEDVKKIYTRARKML